MEKLMTAFHNIKNKGFSLIEMLVYITVLTFMLAIIIEVVVSITRAERVIKTVRNIENGAIVSLERVSREIRAAESVNAASSTLDAHPGALVLSSTDEEGDPRIVRFYLSNGRIYLQEDGVDVGALNSSDTMITSLIFRRFATSSFEGIRIEATIESGTSTHYRIKTFYSSALIR